jgi:hypothetical protein
MLQKAIFATDSMSSSHFQIDESKKVRFSSFIEPVLGAFMLLVFALAPSVTKN